MKIYYINAEGLKLGRLINVIQKTVKCMYHSRAEYSGSPNWLVIVENCSRISTSPNKMRNKKYYFHSGCPGGLRTITWSQMRLSNPEKLVELAFRRMLPNSKQARALLKRLRLHRSSAATYPNSYRERVVVDF